MGKLKIVGTCIFFIVFQCIHSQEYKFGKVSKEELQEKFYPLDSTANAAVLYESKNIHIEYNQSDGFQLITEVYKRVKLYNKEGFAYATDEVFLYKNNSDEENVSGIKGITYTIVNNKIVETKLKKDGIFEEELSENYDQKKFTMPALQEGSVIEYKYKIISPFISNIDRIYLQYQIPIKKIEVKVASPEYYSFKKFTSGYLPVDLKESTHSGKIFLTSKTRSGGNTRSVSKTTFHRDEIDHKIEVNNIISTNVPAFKKEPFSGNVENYISSISYELSYVKFPNESIKYRSTTWEDVTKTIYKSPKFGDELKKINYYKEDIDNLISGVSDPVKRTAVIYNFVKNKMNWNRKRSVYTRNGVRKAYKEGAGNAAEINLMLTSMLTYAHIDANPVVVSTSDRLASLFATLNGFNYVVTRVKLPDNRMMYLDATDKYGMPNTLPDRVIRGTGRVIANNGASQVVNFRPQKPSKNRYSIQCNIDDQGVVRGKLSMHHLDYLAHNFRVAFAEKDEESKIKRLEEKYNFSELEAYTITGIEKYGKGVNERFTFISEDEVEVIEDEIFFSPLLFLRDKENIFKTEKREYPIDFGFGFSNTYVVNIKIPEGYHVVECPESIAFKLPENMGVFSFRSQVANGIIQLMIDETMNTALIPAQYYQSIKEFYNQVIQKENEQVVLKKI